MQLTFLVFLSLLLIALGTVVLISKVNLDKLGVKGEGEVVDIIADEEEVIDPLNHKITLTVYKPLIRYITEDGEEKEVILDVIRRNRGYDIGDKINILYPGSKPDDIIIHSKSNLYRFPTFCIALGVMLFICSFITGIL